MCVHFVDLDIVPKALTHSHTSCLLRADNEKRRRGGEESQREKKVKRRGQRVSFPEGNGAKVKKEICHSNRDIRIWLKFCFYTGCNTEYWPLLI